MTLKGHANTVTGLRVSPDGTHLLSNAMVRPHRQDMLPKKQSYRHSAVVCLRLCVVAGKCFALGCSTGGLDPTVCFKNFTIILLLPALT